MEPLDLVDGQVFSRPVRRGCFTVLSTAAAGPSGRRPRGLRSAARAAGPLPGRSAERARRRSGGGRAALGHVRATGWLGCGDTLAGGRKLATALQPAVRTKRSAVRAGCPGDGRGRHSARAALRYADDGARCSAAGHLLHRSARHLRRDGPYGNGAAELAGPRARMGLLQGIDQGGSLTRVN